MFSFYPGTPDASAAQSVTVAAGQVATGFVMRLVTAETYQVSGTVVDQNGTPVGGSHGDAQERSADVRHHDGYAGRYGPLRRERRILSSVE